MSDKNNNSRLLPRPTFDNSFMFSLVVTIPTFPSAEMDYIKKQFGGGLFAPLIITQFLKVSLDWHWDITKADQGIQNFKNTVADLVIKAKTYGIGLHLVLVYGSSRRAELYTVAKTEDIRNAQWYNDNNLASQSTMAGGKINEEVYTTFSRYARKVYKHMETGVTTVFKYLKTIQDQNPDIILLVSAPGEAELNANRINSPQVLQNYFCDYSPFAILEFRDWLKHEGMYAIGGRFHGEGYPSGGTRFQGTNGLHNFNLAFGTGFNTWNLKYFHWELSDPVDTNYTDNVNPDPHIIPFSQYKFDGMKPESGPFFIAGGFDAPRIMKPKGGDHFWDVFQEFREILVYHHVLNLSAIAKESGFAKSHYYTHQIPGDYLWGTRPNDPKMPLNERYYASASPLWTANVFSDIGMGITAYDLNFLTHYARTTEYAAPAIKSMSTNWGVTEYGPEVIFSENLDDLSPVDSIYQTIKRLYDHNAHLISFFKWEAGVQHVIKGTNREYAIKKFFDAIKDKARQPVEMVFIGTAVQGFTGTYNKTGDVVKLTWSPQIWMDLKNRWQEWGDFKEFVVYRGYGETFPNDTHTEIARTTGFAYSDKTFLKAGKMYYKIGVVNRNNEIGNLATVGVNVPGTPLPVLTLSKNTLYFGALPPGVASSRQSVFITNTGANDMAWSVQKNEAWIQCSVSAGVNDGVIDVGVEVSGKSTGTYTGMITVSAMNALGSPQYINITMTIYKTGEDMAPFGVIETPVENSQVSGSIPVTGWALDNIGVESVQIYRKEGSGRVYIGNAVFVEGVRPDVVAAYPTYPGNSRAGWGYMLLTHFLPNGGNGSYELIAVAKDTTGHETVLGTKKISCDNAHAIKPFGAIDTPAQGGTVFGTSYVNFGWVLTPQPNMIPLNGTTIDVYIDGKNVGHPVYNNFRSDIATLFPAYANSNGAVGYFYINTTKYANGVHTISWVVKDSTGNQEGIGSRYFTIKNEYQ